MEKENKSKEELFGDVICKNLQSFLNNIYSFKEYTFSAMRKQAEELYAYIEKSNKEYSELKKKESVDAFEVHNLINLKNKIDGALFSAKTISNSTIVSLFNSFDFFVKQLLSETCNYLGDKFVIESTIKYEEIKQFNSIQEIQSYYNEQYLEGIFHGSQDCILKSIQGRFNVDCKTNNKHYKDLLFIREIRNIIVHNDSRISQTFKSKMKDYKINYEKYGYFKNDILEINPKKMHEIYGYLVYSAAYITISFISHYFKKNELHDDFIMTINDFLLNWVISKNSDIFAEIYDDLAKSSNTNATKYCCTINKCVCLKQDNKKEEMNNELDNLDWTNCLEKFTFAKNCLLEKYDACISFLKKQENKKIWNFYLQTWPLCSDLLKSDVLLSEYESIFGMSFENKVKKWVNTEEDLNLIKEKYKSKNKNSKK